MAAKVSSLIWTEFELIRNFMPVHVICYFHKDPIKNASYTKGASIAQLGHNVSELKGM